MDRFMRDGWMDEQMATVLVLLCSRRRLTYSLCDPSLNVVCSTTHTRRDKKQDKKRKRGVAPSLALAGEFDSPAPEAVPATTAVAAVPDDVANPV